MHSRTKRRNNNAKPHRPKFFVKSPVTMYKGTKIAPIDGANILKVKNDRGEFVTFHVVAMGRTYIGRDLPEVLERAGLDHVWAFEESGDAALLRRAEDLRDVALLIRGNLKEAA